MQRGTFHAPTFHRGTFVETAQTLLLDRATTPGARAARSRLVSPRDRAVWRAALVATVLNVVGMLISLIELRTIPAMKPWPHLLSMAVGTVLFGLLVSFRHRKDASVAAVAFTLNTAAIVFALWMRTRAIESTRADALPFEPNFLGAMTVALLLPDVRLGALNIAAYIGVAAVQWTLVSAHGHFAPNAPVAFIAYGTFAAVLLAHRVHALHAEERYARAAAENDVRKLLAAVVQTAPVGFHAIDLDGVITLSEGNALEAFGYRSGDLVGASVQELFDRDGFLDAKTGRPLVWPDIFRAVRAGVTVNVDVRVGSHTFEMAFVPMKNGDDLTLSGIGCVSYDITERMAHLDERERLLESEREARAEAQAAVEVRDEFISIASHELRTPLTPLQMGSDRLSHILESEAIVARDRAALEGWLAMFRRQLDRLSKLVKSMLDMTTIESGRLQLETSSVDVAQLVRDVCEGFAVDAQRSGSSLVCNGDEQVMITCDRGRIDQLVSNLVSNAIKYGAGNPIAVCVAKTEAGVKLMVADRGIGIPKDKQPNIFGRFERAVSVRSYGGLGLGLFISKNIVDAHGGSITFRSEPGEGTTFVAEIPYDSGRVDPPNRGP